MHHTQRFFILSPITLRVLFVASLINSTIAADITTATTITNNQTVAPVYRYINNSGYTVISNKPAKNAKLIKLAPLTVYSSPITKDDLYAKPATARLSEEINYSGTGKFSSSNNSNRNINQKNNTRNDDMDKFSDLDRFKNMGTNEATRNSVLEEELAHEKVALIATQKLLQQTENQANHGIKTDKAQIQNIQDSINEHQKNIDNLNKSLKS